MRAKLKLILISLLTLILISACGSDNEVYSYSGPIVNTKGGISSTPNNVIADETFELDAIPGITYICDKENLHLYLDVVRISSEQIYCNGGAYHFDKFVNSMMIKHLLTKGDDGNYHSSDGKFTVRFSTNRLSTIDKRNTSLMPFEGIFKPIENVVDKKKNTEDDIVDNTEEVVDDTLGEEEEVSEDQTANVEFTDREGYTSIRNGSDFLSFTSQPTNEHQYVRICGKFIQNIDNNGMEFRTLDGKTFYVFGGQYTSDDKSTVILDLEFRGINPKYNGHVFDTDSICFNLDKMYHQGDSND